MKRIAYADAVADDRVHRFVPPVRVVREQGNVTDSAALVGSVHAQSFLHFNPRECHLPPGSELILDFGVELNGMLTINTGRMGDLSRVRVTFGESVSETLGVPTQDHAIHQETLSVPKLGQTTFGETAFRFVRLEVPADAPELLLIGVSAIALYRDWEYRGAFESDDARLNRIWEVAAYTVHLNCQQYIYDGVKRDRLVWMGDLYPEVRTILAVFGESGLIEKSLDFVRDSTPDNEWMNGLSSYSCWWVICQYDLFLYRGDYAFLREQKGTLAKLLARLLACVGPDGSEALSNGRFLDWSTASDEKSKHAGLQGLLAWTFDCGAALAQELNDSRLALRCRVAAAKLRTVAPDCGGNKIAAAMQILGGIGDAARLNAEVMRSRPDRGISTFYGYFVLLARAATGDVAGALDVIRNYWGGMLDFGATTFWEDFDLDWTRNAFGIDQLPVPGKDDIHGDFGKYCYQGLRHSLCHGWSGGPAAFLTEKVLGICPAAPGFTRVRIEPCLDSLSRVEGVQPTPFGDIELSVRRVGNHIRRTLKLPKEIREV